MEKWGEYIKIKRLKAGLTQEELAEKMGVSRPTLSRLENDNENRPTVKVISGLSKAFGLAEKEVVQEVYGIGSCTYSDLIKLELDRVPVYQRYPYVGGTMPTEYVYRARRNTYHKVEAYIVDVLYETPTIEKGDIILVDREAKIQENDILLYRYNDKAHIGKLRDIHGQIYVEDSNIMVHIEKIAHPSLVIGIEKKLK